MNAVCMILKNTDGTSRGRAPVASFDVDNSNPNVGDTLQFTDTSIKVPTSWEWTVNGALFSNQQNPSFYCDTQGFFIFELMAKNQYGEDDYSMQIQVMTGGIQP